MRASMCIDRPSGVGMAKYMRMCLCLSVLACGALSTRDVRPCAFAPLPSLLGDIWSPGHCVVAAALRDYTRRYEPSKGSSPPSTGAASVLGNPGTRDGYHIVKTLSLPTHLPQSERDAARLRERAEHHRSIQPATPAEGSHEGMSAALALNILFPDDFPSISSARKAIRRGEVISQEQCELSMSSVLVGADVVHLQTRAAPGLFPQGKKPFDLPILYEDDDIAVVVKPPGVAMYKGARKGSTDDGTMVSALAYVLKPTTLIAEALQRPQPMHRLDQGTGGVVVAVKTRAAAQELQRQFEERKVRQEYEAIVCGELVGKGRIDTELSGKRAVTDFETLAVVKSLKYGHVSRVHVLLHTGRTHQIRRHLVSISHPLVGDKVYNASLCGRPEWTPGQTGMMLWATKLVVTHPSTGEEMSFESRPPTNKFDTFLVKEQERWDKLHSQDPRPDVSRSRSRKSSNTTSAKQEAGEGQG